MCKIKTFSKAIQLDWYIIMFYVPVQNVCYIIEKNCCMLSRICWNKFVLIIYVVCRWPEETFKNLHRPLQFKLATSYSVILEFFARTKVLLKYELIITMIMYEKNVNKLMFCFVFFHK